MFYRKALKATVVLLPLLGIVNLVWLVPSPKATDHPVWIVIYHYLLLFLDAFQGLLVGLLYCFLNTEVSDKAKPVPGYGTKTSSVHLTFTTKTFYVRIHVLPVLSEYFNSSFIRAKKK